MAFSRRRHPNEEQQANHIEDINTVFVRFEARLFRKDILSLALNGTRPKLSALQEALQRFREDLVDESLSRRDSFSVDTARALSSALADFFDTNDVDRKKRAISDFWGESRQARFSRRTKTIVAGALGALVLFGLSLGLIIGTGGLPLIGIGAMIGISVALGCIGGAIGGFLQYKYGKNEHETRGQAVRKALLTLADDAGIIAFCRARKNKLFPRQESALVSKMREQYQTERPGAVTMPALPDEDETKRASVAASASGPLDRVKSFFGTESRPDSGRPPVAQAQALPAPEGRLSEAGTQRKESVLKPGMYGNKTATDVPPPEGKRGWLSRTFGSQTPS